MSQQRDERLLQVDGLRAIAIGIVVLFHYVNNQLTNATDQIPKRLAQLTSFGWCGVDLFFVLSGFLITRILLHHRDSSQYFLTFYVRRTLRILPIYMIFLLVWLAFRMVDLFPNNEFLVGNEVVPMWMYFTMTQNIGMAYMHSMGNDVLSITWSLGIEEQFYLLFPFLVRYLKEPALWLVLFFAIAVACFSRSGFEYWVPKYVAPHCRIDSLSLGAIIAAIDRSGFFQSPLSPWWIITAGLVMTLFIASYWLVFHDLGIFKHTLIGFVFASSLALSLTGKPIWFIRLLSNRVFLWLSKISYSLYLTHYFVLGLMHAWLLGTDGIGILGIQDVAVSVLALCLSLMLSWALFLWIETPFIRFGKSFHYGKHAV
jgi:peptidoglycan/LPS O-acetylase OafA/YrhL